jgi:hypothetical protein
MLRRLSRTHAALTALAVLCAGLPACRPGRVAQAVAPEPPSVAEATGERKCGVRQSSSKPLIVEWPSTERAALEARAARGLVAVRYEGCEMEVLTSCRAQGSYAYLGLTQKREGVTIRDADDLYAQLPVGAASLEGKLERSGQLNVDMVIVGRKEADRHEFTEDDLDGRCAEATHVVTGLTIGAFSFYAGSGAEISGSAQIGNLGAGASSSTDREVLKQDGSGAQCELAGTADEAPPEGCGALLRVEVVPIERTVAAAHTSSSPADTGPTPPQHPGPVDPALVRKAKTWQAVTLTGYAGMLGSIGVMTYGLIRRGGANVASTEPGTERQDAIRQVKVGEGLMWGGIAGTALFLGLVVVGNNRWVKARRELAGGTAHRVSPLIGPSTGGLSWRGRF